MLPIYAVALGLRPRHFDDCFKTPLYRMRLSSYAPTPHGEFGINPHVDTSFFTILATSGPGLVVSHAQSRSWLRVPHKPGGFVVNFGELLSQITNDQWPATRHYAIHKSDTNKKGGRYSLPFFFNATPTHPMAVLPTCCSSKNPAKYPPVSYLEGQGVVQGE
jgi:isopenicillin N synthase-like dioxygenase